MREFVHRNHALLLTRRTMTEDQHDELHAFSDNNLHAYDLVIRIEDDIDEFEKDTATALVLQQLMHPGPYNPTGGFLAAPRSRDNTTNAARTLPTQPLYRACRCG
jgi:hypothetical protein